MALDDRKIVFTGAGQQPVQAVGRFFRVREADSVVYVKVDSRPEVELEKGEQIDLGAEFKSLIVRSAIAQTVKIRTSSDRQDDNRAVVSVNTTTTIDPSNNINGAAKKTCLAAGSVQIVAGNANRVRLIIKIPSDQPDGVWLDGAASSADNGDFIEQGERLILGTTAELWAYGNGVEDVVIAVSEEEII